jgi:hypothetical protein
MRSLEKIFELNGQDPKLAFKSGKMVRIKSGYLMYMPAAFLVDLPGDGKKRNNSGKDENSPAFNSSGDVL